MKFPEVTFEEIIDSRGLPSIAVKAEFNGEPVYAKVPGGTSTGSHEAAVLPPAQILSLSNELNQYLANSDFTTLSEFDRALIKKDGTNNKSRLGGNTILALSMLYCRLAALSNQQSLAAWLESIFIANTQQLVPTVKKTAPVPMMVMIEGGKHASLGTFIQEILINGSVETGQQIWQALERKGYPLGMEGGFDIPYQDEAWADKQALADLSQVIQRTATMATISVDIAANNLPAGRQYQVADYIQMIKEWHLFSLEDPFKEDDWKNWAQLMLEVKGHRLDTVIVGDDLTVTNSARLEEALDRKAISGVIVKPNQVGTISETLDFVTKAQKHQFFVIVSHRSGETDDTFISDLAVAVGADALKAGAPSKPERQVKYDRLRVLLNSIN